MGENFKLPTGWSIMKPAEEVRADKAKYQRICVSLADGRPDVPGQRPPHAAEGIEAGRTGADQIPRFETPLRQAKDKNFQNFFMLEAPGPCS